MPPWLLTLWGNFMTNPTIAAPTPRSGSLNANVQRSLEGSIPLVLLSFATPSLVQILVQSAIAVIEIFLLSRLGTDVLAGISAVFPIVTLFVAITTVGMGGAISSAVARALGAGNVSEAQALAAHAILLSLIFGAISAAALIFCGPQIYGLLGARGDSLNQALSYSNIVFGGSISLWLLGGVTAIVRGTGDMKTPARIAIFRAAAALPLFGILIFGWGAVPGFGIAGAATAMLIYYTMGVIGLLVHLQSAKSPIQLTLSDFRPRWQLFSRILKVALLSSLQILVSNVALIAITAYVAHFGIEALAGYGLAARVELLISSMVLALGVGTTTMVGTCVGAGLEARARRVTLVSCLLAAAIFAAIGLGVAFSGRSIAGLFTHVEEVVLAASGYFYATGLVYGFMAAFVILFSAYQGWGQATAPLLASLLRVAIVLAGGWMLQQQAPQLDWLYYLVAGSTVIGALTLGIVFAVRSPNRRVLMLSG
jgi:putative MATE family efflux protein